MFDRIALLLSLVVLTGCGRSQPSVVVAEHNYNWTCSWDGTQRNDTIRVFKPAYASGRLPVIAFHHGRGLSYRDYDQVLKAVAEHGVVIASVSDDISFIDREGVNPLPDYDSVSPGAGMVSASYAIERALTEIVTIEPSADRERAYLVGHSRGGGAVEACHARNVRVSGFGYLMAFDIYGWTPMPDRLPPSRVLIVAATLDGNLGYAFTVGIAAHFTGDYTLDVIYGGNHDFVSDTLSEAPATITREDEHSQVVKSLVNLARGD